MKAKCAIVILLFCFTPVCGQTVADIETKFGKKQDVYSVSERIWMTPQYAADGQVCRMSFYPKRIGSDTNYVGATLQFHELRNLLNLIVPPEDRGLKAKLNFGVTATGGPAVWTTYPYQRVTFTFIGAFVKSPDLPLLTQGEFVFTVPANANAQYEESSAPSKDDFSRIQVLKTEIVTLEWNDRKCVAP